MEEYAQIITPPLRWGYDTAIFLEEWVLLHPIFYGRQAFNEHERKTLVKLYVKQDNALIDTSTSEKWIKHKM